MCTQPEFEDYLEKRNDIIDNLSYQLAVTFCKIDTGLADEDVLPWDMAVIGAINEAVEGILHAHGSSTCWPYNDNDIPCFLTDSCTTKGCPLKISEPVQLDTDMEGTKNES